MAATEPRSAEEPGAGAVPVPPGSGKQFARGQARTQLLADPAYEGAGKGFAPGVGSTAVLRPGSGKQFAPGVRSDASTVPAGSGKQFAPDVGEGSPRG